MAIRFDQDIDGEDLVRAPCISAKQVKDTIVFVIIPYSLQIADGDEDLKQPKNQKSVGVLSVG